MTYQKIVRCIVMATMVLSCTALLQTLTAQTPAVSYSFKVAVTLTPSARRKLLERNEKLRLFGYFYGRPSLAFALLKVRSGWVLLPSNALMWMLWLPYQGHASRYLE